MGLRRGAAGAAPAVPCSSCRPSRHRLSRRHRREGEAEGTQLLAAPGVGDDTRGLALLLALVRALDAAKFTTPSATSCSSATSARRARGTCAGRSSCCRRASTRTASSRCWPSTAATSTSITRGGVGSMRYRVTFKGPGGHSYGAFGLVNPAYRDGRGRSRGSAPQGARVAEDHLRHRRRPRRHLGELDSGRGQHGRRLRSESCAELKKVNDAFLAIVREAVDEENKPRSTREGRIEADPKVIGDRPCGETAADAPIVQAAAAAIRAFGDTPPYTISSTDANVPMSMGIPAMTIGRGGPGGRTHSLGRMDRRRAGGQRQNVQACWRHRSRSRVAGEVIRSALVPQWRPS